MKNKILSILFCLLMASCIQGGKITLNLVDSKKSTISDATVSNVQIINNELVVTGTGLSGVTNIKINGQSFNENFSIETQTATKITARSIQAFAFDISKTFNVILADANASASFPIDFSLCNSTLNNKSIDCSVTAQDGDVLAYDQSSDKWKPTAVSGVGSPVIGLNGYAKLALNTTEPITCDASSIGALAMNYNGEVCTCSRGTAGWLSLRTNQACLWSLAACGSTIQATGQVAGNSTTCSCSPALVAAGTVSGSSDAYTNTSSICRAALHAGKTSVSGGDITYYVDNGDLSYTGTTSNGVTSTSSGSTALKLKFTQTISM